MHAQIDAAHANGKDEGCAYNYYRYSSDCCRYMLPDQEGQSAVQAERCHGVSAGEAVPGRFNDPVYGGARTLKHELQQGV